MRTSTYMKLLFAGVLFTITACSSLPERIDTLEQARTTIRELERDPLAREAASVELSQAKQSVAAADRAYDESEDLEIIAHHAYVADRHARIAEQQIAEARAMEELSRSEARRNEVLLEAREREAEIQAERAAQAEERAEALAGELETIQSQDTDRGIVLTLSDILFATDQSSLRPGAATTLDELAAFLADYRERQLLIEGHADSRGPAAYNRDLSLRRARAVRDALITRGIAPDRLQTVGFGEEYPVASNQTTAGMQQNRRVEIVLSDGEGDFPAGVMERSADLVGMNQ
jgi:outer membrane protein OmpA-like peptidoglycan-associated protein